MKWTEMVVLELRVRRAQRQLDSIFVKVSPSLYFGLLVGSNLQTWKSVGEEKRAALFTVQSNYRTASHLACRLMCAAQAASELAGQIGSKVEANGNESRPRVGSSASLSWSRSESKSRSASELVSQPASQPASQSVRSEPMIRLPLASWPAPS